MLAAGFPPDTISSDVHDLNIGGPVFEQATTLSKFLALGMPLADVVQATTANPAAAIRRLDLGTLRPGSIGDATIFSLEPGRHELTDSIGNTTIASEHIAISGSVLGGRFVARN
jgi:dihydroorotase